MATGRGRRMVTTACPRRLRSAPAGRALARAVATRAEAGGQIVHRAIVSRVEADGAENPAPLRSASAEQAAKNFELFGAPHVAIVTTETALGVYGAVACGLYVQSFLLAAQSLGVGAIPQAALAIDSTFVREYFDLPDTRRVVCGISFGWPAPDV